MRTRTLIGAGLAVALAGAMLSYQLPASAQPYGGPGMMGRGYGPGMMGSYGHMGGWGGGTGQGQWNCPAFGGGGYGPGMMRGYGPGFGPGYDRRADAQGNQPLNLTTDEVKSRVERWLAWQGNQRLKLGDVKEKDADTITADVVTKDNSLVQRFVVDRHTGNYRPSED